jgi:hypothetical protein
VKTSVVDNIGPCLQRNTFKFFNLICIREIQRLSMVARDMSGISREQCLAFELIVFIKMTALRKDLTVNLYQK